jgi:hypothetical protein
MVAQTLVFVSHTSEMSKHPAGQSFVDGAEEAINSIDGAKAFHMGFFPAADVPPASYSIQQLQRADVFIAVIGFDFGSTVPGEDRSYTELEFDSATELGKERLVFLLDPAAASLAGNDAARVDVRQVRFRRKLETSGNTVAYFTDVGDLKYRVRQAVEQSVARRSSPVGALRTLPAPSARTVGRALSVAGLVAVLVVAAIGFTVWTAVAGSLPPWQPQSECSTVTAEVVSSSKARFGTFDQGAALDIVVRNGGDRAVTIPAARQVVARGEGGTQYASIDSLADRSWFFDVRVEARSSVRVQLGLSNPTGGSDVVTVVIPGVRGSGLPILRCRVSAAPVSVTFSG